VLDRLAVLAKWVCFTRARARQVVTDSGGLGWFGRCEHCRLERFLQWSHIEPQGRCPHLRYDPDNYRALCWHCHFHWWHKGGAETEAWIRGLIGDARRDRLGLMARTRGHRMDPEAVRLMLLDELHRMGVVPLFDTEGRPL